MSRVDVLDLNLNPILIPSVDKLLLHPNPARNCLCTIFLKDALKVVTKSKMSNNALWFNIFSTSVVTCIHNCII